jgi:hypothetical protein
MLFTGLTFAVAAPLVLVWPAWKMEIFGLSVLVGLVGLALRWTGPLEGTGGLFDEGAPSEQGPMSPSTGN